MRTSGWERSVLLLLLFVAREYRTNTNPFPPNKIQKGREILGPEIQKLKNSNLEKGEIQSREDFWETKI
jgi:hypothetical protein